MNMDTADNQGSGVDGLLRKSDSEIIEKLVEKITIQATQLASLGHAFNGSADCIEICEGGVLESVHRSLSRSSQDYDNVEHSKRNVAAMRMTELDLRKRLEDAEQSLAAKNCRINELQGEISCRDRQLKLSEKKALETGREVQKMKAAMDCSQHTLRLSQKSSDFATANTKTMSAQKSEIAALKAYLISYQKRLDTSQKTERSLASRLSILEDQIDAQQPMPDQYDMGVKVRVLTERNRQLKAELESMKAGVMNSQAVGTQPDGVAGFEVSFSNENLYEKGASSQKDSHIASTAPHDDKNLNTTNKSHTKSTKKSDVADHDDYLSSEEYAVRLKVVERERDVLLEFIKGDMQKSSECNAELRKEQERNRFLENEIINEKTKNQNRSKVPSAELQSSKGDDVLHCEGFQSHDTVVTATYRGNGVVQYCDSNERPTSFSFSSPINSKVLLNDPKDASKYTECRTERTELMDDTESLRHFKGTLTELASDLMKFDKIEVNKNSSRISVTPFKKGISDSDQATRSYSHNYLRGLGKSKSNSSVISDRTNTSVLKIWNEGSGSGPRTRLHIPGKQPLTSCLDTPSTANALDSGSVIPRSTRHESWVSLPSVARISQPLYTKLKELVEDLRQKEDMCSELESGLESIVEENDISNVEFEEEIIKLTEALFRSEKKHDELKKDHKKENRPNQFSEGNAIEVLRQTLDILCNVPGGWEQFFDRNIIEYLNIADRHEIEVIDGSCISHDDNDDNPSGENSWARTNDPLCVGSPTPTIFRDSQREPSNNGFDRVGVIGANASTPSSWRFHRSSESVNAAKDFRSLLTSCIIDENSPSPPPPPPPQSQPPSNFILSYKMVPVLVQRAVSMVCAISAELRDKHSQLFSALADLSTAHTALASSKADSGILTSRLESLQMRDMNRVEAFTHIESSLQNDLTRSREVTYEREIEIVELNRKIQDMTKKESMREAVVHISRNGLRKEKHPIISGSSSLANQLVPQSAFLSQNNSAAVNHATQMKSKELQKRKKDFSSAGSPSDSSPVTPGPPPRLTNRTPSKNTPKGISEEMDLEDDSCQTPDTEHSSIETEHSSPESSLHQDSDNDSIESFPDYGSVDCRSSRDTNDTPPSIELSSGASPIFRSFSMGQESHRSSKGSLELPKLTFDRAGNNHASVGSSSRNQRRGEDLERQYSAHSLSTSDPRETIKIISTQRSASFSSRNLIDCKKSDAAASHPKSRQENSSPTRQLDSLLRKAKMTFAALRKEIELESSY